MTLQSQFTEEESDNITNYSDQTLINMFSELDLSLQQARNEFVYRVAMATELYKWGPTALAKYCQCSYHEAQEAIKFINGDK